MRRASWAVILFLALSGGYTTLWLVISGKIDPSIQRWKATEREAGRAWTCADETISGFPFEISFTCNKPRLDSLLGDKRVVTAGSLVLSAHIFRPSRIDIGLTGGLSLIFSNSVADLSFDAFKGSAEWTGKSAFSLVVSSQNLVLSTATDNVLRDWNGARLNSFKLQISDLGTIRSDARVLDISADLQQARVATRKVFAFNEAPIDGKVIAQVTHSGFFGNSALDQLERWRADGGVLTILDASATYGSSNIALAGTFHLDELHRPAGKADVRFNDGATLANLLRSMSNGAFGFGAGSSRPGGAQRPVQVPVSLTNGRVFVGPIDTRLKTYPLY